MDLPFNFPSTNFETFHGIWEEMIRFERPQERFEKIQLGEVYRIEIREYSNYKNSISSCIVDAKSELTSIQFPDSNNKHLPVQLNTIINSTKENNLGWDRLIFYECFQIFQKTIQQTTKNMFFLCLFKIN